MVTRVLRSLVEIILSNEGSRSYRPGQVKGLYQPEPPMGFVSRRDPNFYLLKRHSA